LTTKKKGKRFKNNICPHTQEWPCIHVPVSPAEYLRKEKIFQYKREFSPPFSKPTKTPGSWTDDEKNFEANHKGGTPGHRPAEIYFSRKTKQGKRKGD
jgi:hypothetical protein